MNDMQLRGQQLRECEQIAKQFNDIIDLRWQPGSTVHGELEIRARAFGITLRVFQVPVGTNVNPMTMKGLNDKKWWACVDHDRVTTEYPFHTDHKEIRDDPLECLKDVLLPKAVQTLSDKRNAIDECISNLETAATPQGSCQVCGHPVTVTRGKPRCRKGHLNTLEMDRTVARWGFS